MVDILILKLCFLFYFLEKIKKGWFEVIDFNYLIKLYIYLNIKVRYTPII